MGTGENHFFPLTCLQIGDLQSYLSRLTLFLAPESNKLFILVDNRPWLIDCDTRPAHLWQLMVTKSRLSPFANTRAKREKKSTGKSLDSISKSDSITLKRWFSLIDAASYQKKALIPVKKLRESLLLNKELHHTLYGFIVFEVPWNNVRGINYLNELQTDTSMALEAKLMKRWEFDSIEQASSWITSWYSGTFHELRLIQEYLNNISTKEDVFTDAEDDMSINPDGDTENVTGDDDFNEDKALFYCSGDIFQCPGVEYIPHTPPPPSGSYKRRKIMRFSGGSGDEISEEAYNETVSSHSVSSSSSFNSDNEDASLAFEATNYKDVLILFRFNDHDLPFKLKEIIMSDVRLLTLLEYGLPSWVIFLQSYPLFCQMYRPWMCPLARALYVLMSIVTVLVGFYDLYKNVPLIKATASRLFGPFFDWIETWEMISRIKYLGTMFFLHNFEKAVKWLLMVTRAIRSLLSVLTKPIAGPIMELVEFILPLCSIFLEAVEWLSSVIWIILESSCTVIMGVLQIILWPFWMIVNTVSTIATLVIYPIVWLLWEILIAPVRLILAMASFVGLIFSNVYYVLWESWSSVSGIFEFASASGAAKGAYEPSMLRSLWNDLFSQVFRALRSILYGFVAFFSTCNRHRLSIYNHIQEFLLRVSHVTHRSTRSDRGLWTVGPKSFLEEIEIHKGSCSHPSLSRERLLQRRGSMKSKQM